MDWAHAGIVYVRFPFGLLFGAVSLQGLDLVDPSFKICRMSNSIQRHINCKVLHKKTVNELDQENEDKKYNGLYYDESG